MSKFLKGILILLTAGFVTRILGFFNRIVIARSIGEEGVGLYMMAYPTFILAVTITQFGLPVAISKRVAEALALGQTRKVKKILVIALATTLILSFIFTPALFIGAPYLAETFFTDKRIMYPLLTIAPVIPIIAVSSVLRGYFQGTQNMRPSAVSQIIEQLVRILFIGFLAKLFLPYGVEFAAAAVMIATICGELVSLIYLLTMFKLKKAFPFRKKIWQSFQNGSGILRELMSIAVPTLGSRMIGSISWFLEPIIVTQALAISGLASINATKQYGLLTGFALPLLLLPSFITNALSTSLVPAISEAKSLNHYLLVEKRIQQALKFCIVTGALATVILYTLNEPLMMLLYNSTNAAVFITIMAPFMVFSYLQAPLQATLQALDLAKAAMINSLIGTIVKLILFFVLASNAQFGIHGVALAMIIGFVLVTFLHLATIMKAISFTIYLREYLKIFLCTILTGYLGERIWYSLKLAIPLFGNIAITSACMALIFSVLLLLFRVMRLKDLQRFMTFLKK